MCGAVCESRVSYFLAKQITQENEKTSTHDFFYV